MSQNFFTYKKFLVTKKFKSQKKNFTKNFSCKNLKFYSQKNISYKKILVTKNFSHKKNLDPQKIVTKNI